MGKALTVKRIRNRRFETQPAFGVARFWSSERGFQGSQRPSPIRDLTVAAPLKREKYACAAR